MGRIGRGSDLLHISATNGCFLVSVHVGLSTAMSHTSRRERRPAAEPSWLFVLEQAVSKCCLAHADPLQAVVLSRL